MDSLHSCHGGEKRLFSGKGEGVAASIPIFGCGQGGPELGQEGSRRKGGQK